MKQGKKGLTFVKNNIIGKFLWLKGILSEHKTFAAKYFLASHFSKIEFKIIAVCGKFGGDDGRITVKEVTSRLTAYSPFLSEVYNIIIILIYVYSPGSFFS